jgi:hypothetical protein
MTTKITDRFLAADCSPDADLKLGKEEIMAMAKEFGYPIEAIAAERGVTL